MARGSFRKTGLRHGFFDSFLHQGSVDVMTSLLLGLAVDPTAVLGKDPFPAPVLRHIGVLAVEGIGKQDAAPSIGEILLVNSLDPLEVVLERHLERVGQHASMVIRSFAPLPSNQRFLEPFPLLRQINISGNDFTPDNIIRSQLTFDEQEALNTRAIKEFYQRLLALDLFGEVEIRSTQIDADKVDLEVRVKEKPNDQYDRALKNKGSVVKLQSIYVVVVDTLGKESVFRSMSNNITPRRELESFISNFADRLKVVPSLNLPPSAKIKTDIVEAVSGADVFLAILGKQDNTLPKDFVAELGTEGLPPV